MLCGLTLTSLVFSGCLISRLFEAKLKLLYNFCVSNLITQVACLLITIAFFCIRDLFTGILFIISVLVKEIVDLVSAQNLV